MTPTLQTVLDQLLLAHQGGSKLVLLFDYDGTLVPLVEHPRLAEVPSEIHELLERLTRQPRLFVGILSGRSLDDLEEMVGLPNIYYCGTGGMELNLLGVHIRHPWAETARDLMAGLVPTLERAAAKFPGSWVEKKMLGLTVHYRALAPERARAFRGCAERALRNFASRLRILDGPMAIEVTPAFGWTKGNAVGMIVEHAGPGSVPLYAGDEANDEEAMKAVQARDGFALGIGPRAPQVAKHRLPDPAALVNFLYRLLAGLVA